MTTRRPLSVSAFVERALAFFAGDNVTARRVMTDNAFTFHVKNRSLRELLGVRGIRHLTTQPYRPRTNGKVCVSPWVCHPAGWRGSRGALGRGRALAAARRCVAASLAGVAVREPESVVEELTGFLTRP
jgi:hypothetical protein